MASIVNQLLGLQLLLLVMANKLVCWTSVFVCRCYCPCWWTSLVILATKWPPTQHIYSLNSVNLMPCCLSQFSIFTVSVKNIDFDVSFIRQSSLSTAVNICCVDVTSIQSIIEGHCCMLSLAWYFKWIFLRFLALKELDPLYQQSEM